MARNEEQGGGGGQRVLVVDDHPDTAEVLSMMFHVFGCETRGEVRGRSALIAAREFDPDLIVVDIGLPDIDGYEVVHELRSDPHIGCRMIVAVTGWSRTEDLERAFAAGFDDYFTKPVDSATLRRMLRAAAVRRSDLERMQNCTHSFS